MRFAQSGLVHLFWLAIGLGLFLIWAYRRRKSLTEEFAQAHLLAEISSSFDARNCVLKYFLILFVFAFGILALMRPQWGFKWQEVKREGADILMAMDVSKSMLTEDIKPTRLERAKLAVRDLIKRLQGDRIGLIAFAGTSFLVCPLTIDYNGFLLSLDDLGPDTIPRGGTNIASAIKEAIKGYGNVSGKYKAIVMITDGENLEGDPMEVAREAKDKGIKIYCIGVGTKEGDLIRFENDKGEMEFLKDKQGNFVKSRLDEDFLQKISLTTDGVYVRAGAVDLGLELIYNKYLSRMEKREIKSQMEKRFSERFQIPLGIATLLLIMETLVATRRKI